VHSLGLSDPSTIQNYTFAITLELHAPSRFHIVGASHCLRATRLVLRTLSASLRSSRDRCWHRFRWAKRTRLLAPAPAHGGWARERRRGLGLVFSYYLCRIASAVCGITALISYSRIRSKNKRQGYRSCVRFASMCLFDIGASFRTFSFAAPISAGQHRCEALSHCYTANKVAVSPQRI
jgi:hypothetical protein